MKRFLVLCRLVLWANGWCFPKEVVLVASAFCTPFLAILQKPSCPYLLETRRSEISVSNHKQEDLTPQTGYSRLPITRTFKGNRKNVRVIGSSKQQTRIRKWDWGGMQVSCTLDSTAPNTVLLYWTQKSKDKKCTIVLK